MYQTIAFDFVILSTFLAAWRPFVSVNIYCWQARRDTTMVEVAVNLNFQNEENVTPSSIFNTYGFPSLSRCCCHLLKHTRQENLEHGDLTYTTRFHRHGDKI